MNERAVQSPSYPMLAVTDRGRVFNLTTLAELSQHDHNSRGGVTYKRVSILIEGKNHKPLVHRLVCEAFHGRAPDKRSQVAHGDNDTFNNSATNLRWATQLENCADKTSAGRQSSKLTAAQALEIRTRRASGERGRDLAREFGVSDATISEIHHNKLWTHLQDAS